VRFSSKKPIFWEVLVSLEQGVRYFYLLFDSAFVMLYQNYFWNDCREFFTKKCLCQFPQENCLYSENEVFAGASILSIYEISK